MEKTLSLEDSRSDSIQWKQLWSLAAMYASIIIGWIAYHNYQPKLLEKFNFLQYALWLTIAQAAILVITPPIAGRMGDRFRFSRGHRLPIISTGIAFAAMVFMAVAFTLVSNPGEYFKWILPVLIILWLVAMSIFTSPALSTLELFTPVEKLPVAMAVITIVGNLIYSLEPVIVDIIDYLGAPLTFIAGGVVVFLSGYSLKQNSLGLFQQNSGRPRAVFTLDTKKSPYTFIFFLGAGLGIATTALFKFFPAVLYTHLGSKIGMDPKYMIVLILVISAIVSLPAGKVIDKFGIQKVFWYSLAAIIVSILGVLLINSWVVVFFFAVTFALSFTTLSVSSLPLAINEANYYEKVFCVGIFFSGVELPDGLVDIFMAI
ncbi:MAG TPA: MFS transporter [Cyclobacteriaceae bacterium]|nr:MFS transporter [Cyclobacteriaceae bacterium]